MVSIEKRDLTFHFPQFGVSQGLNVVTKPSLVDSVKNYISENISGFNPSRESVPFRGNWSLYLAKMSSLSYQQPNPNFVGSGPGFQLDFTYEIAGIEQQEALEVSKGGVNRLMQHSGIIDIRDLGEPKPEFLAVYVTQDDLDEMKSWHEVTRRFELENQRRVRQGLMPKARIKYGTHRSTNPNVLVGMILTNGLWEKQILPEIKALVRE